MKLYTHIKPAFEFDIINYKFTMQGLRFCHAFCLLILLSGFCLLHYAFLRSSSLTFNPQLGNSKEK